MSEKNMVPIVGDTLVTIDEDGDEEYYTIDGVVEDEDNGEDGLWSVSAEGSEYTIYHDGERWLDNDADFSGGE